MQVAYHRPKVNPSVLKNFSKVSSWKSLLLCIAIYAAVVALAIIGGPASGWWLAPVSVLLIAGLQMHLLILLHEGAHRLLHPNRWMNEFLADIFCGIPLFIYEKNYRALHLNHHHYSGSPQQDPEVALYESQGYRYERKTGWPLVKMLIFDVVGVHLVGFLVQFNRFLAGQRAKAKLESVNMRDLALTIVLWGGVFTAAYAWGFLLQVLIFWFLPMATLTIFFLKLHGYGEHTGATGPTEFERTWVHDYNPVENFFIYPIKSGYHLEHHLFPSVPWYNMEKFRSVLLQDPLYREHSQKVVSKSFFFGPTSIWSNMIAGTGVFWRDALKASNQENPEDHLSKETEAEVKEQIGLA
ncbi:MAG: fatty acid desaturase family protein [Oligoflexia bacterium]|nr:fatty acid desaturase family protein [Oligoflexia bacterium]